MKTTPTGIAGVVLVESDRRVDQRGSFSRLFCAQSLRAIVGARTILQINQSRTEEVGAVRGLHYQAAPHAEMKLVRCVAGRVWDVAVDLRRGSPTFLQWHSEELSRENARMLVVPEGCAHGFQVLDKHSELLYLHTAYYAPESESGIQPADPMLAIRWPLPITSLSDRDRSHKLLTPDFRGLPL